MSTAEEYIAVIGSFQGCLLFGLLFFDGRLSTASRVLGVMCLMMASVFLMPFLLGAADGPLGLLIGWLFYFPAAAGALAYLYCRSALLARPLRRRDVLLFIPYIGCNLLTADIFLGDPAVMAHWISGGSASTWRLQASEYLLFLQAFAYATVTASMIWRYRRQANDNLANFNPAIFRWMLMLQLFTIAIWVLNALPSLSSASIRYAQAANLLMVILIYVIAIAQWRRPALFTIVDLADTQDRLSATDPDEQSGAGELTAEQRAQIFETIRATMEAHKLYLDGALTLTDLAQATDLSRHQVSETLNRHAGKNFYEFVNSYRIATVCERLKSSDDKVLDIALDAGFSSKSTFNAIFKQFTGQTPTQYRRSMASGDA